MDGFDVVSTEAFQVRNEFRVGAVGMQDGVELEVLHFCYVFLAGSFGFLVFFD